MKKNDRLARCRRVEEISRAHLRFGGEQLRGSPNRPARLRGSSPGCCEKPSPVCEPNLSSCDLAFERVSYIHHTFTGRLSGHDAIKVVRWLDILKKNV